MANDVNAMYRILANMGKSEQSNSSYSRNNDAQKPASYQQNHDLKDK